MSEDNLWSYQMDELIKEIEGKPHISTIHADLKIRHHWEAYHNLPSIHDLKSIESINKNFEIYDHAMKWSIKLKQALLYDFEGTVGYYPNKRESIQLHNDEIITGLRESIFFLENSKKSMEQLQTARYTLWVTIGAVIIAIMNELKKEADE
jgi:hypothetical protein